MMFIDTSTASVYLPSLETAARARKVVPIVAPVHGDAEIETAISALRREPGGGLVIIPDGFTRRLSEARELSLAAPHRVFLPRDRIGSILLQKSKKWGVEKSTCEPRFRLGPNGLTFDKAI